MINKEYRWHKDTGKMIGTFFCDTPLKNYETREAPVKEKFEHEEELPEYNFAQLNLLIHSLECLDTSLYDVEYKKVHKHLLTRYRKIIKNI